MPVLLVLGLALVFGGDEQSLYKVGVVSDGSVQVNSAQVDSPQVDQVDQAELVATHDHDPFTTRYIEYLNVPVDQRDAAIEKVNGHRLDLLVDMTQQPYRYWVNSESPKGYAAENIVLQASAQPLQRMTLTSASWRYVDWLIPGVLGMNIMFSCLFGVGYVLVRYRKSGFLKRLNATPLTAVEFLSAQILSRLTLIVVATVLVYVGTDLILDFRMMGSYLALLLLLMVGSACMIALGLLVAARVASEELAGGLLNLFSWPMMVLSGVWFSLEGSPQWVIYIAQVLPLTHLIDAARIVMLDGGGVVDIASQLSILLGMTMAFMLAGAAWFRWRM